MCPLPARLDVSVLEHLAACDAEVFATFDHRRQDSGNLSFGVELNGVRLFIKTAGRPPDGSAAFAHPRRVASLRNAATLHREISHPSLARLRAVIETPEGPALVYDWLDGECLYSPAHERTAPGAPLRRLRERPLEEILSVLDSVFDLHTALARGDWVAVDFYDGCILYDFTRRCARVIDLDMYRRGAFRNDVGRLPGSSRFMAPEEHVRGATIDERTMVFVMGRTGRVLLTGPEDEPVATRVGGDLLAVLDTACEPERRARHEHMEAFHSAWSDAREARP